MTTATDRRLILGIEAFFFFFWRGGDGRQQRTNQLSPELLSPRDARRFTFHSMPTFQSISLHPRLRQRLSEDGGVRTPQALLSRNPRSLFPNTVATTTMEPQMIDSLRHQVALAMIQQTRTGKYRKKQDNAAPLLPGASWTVREGMQQQQESNSSWSTGCQALDAWLSLEETNDTTTNKSGTAVGGQVLVLSGPSGKTQVALQLARAASSSASHSNPQRVRYCYSTAGHAGLPNYQHLGEGGHRIEFQPVSNVTQLFRILSALEVEWSEDRGPGMIIIDSLSHVFIDDDNFLDQRWKRLARLYSVNVVLVVSVASTMVACDTEWQCRTTAVTTGESAQPNLEVTLLRHPTRLISESQPESICLIHTRLGLTTPSAD